MDPSLEPLQRAYELLGRVRKLKTAAMRLGRGLRDGEELASRAAISLQRGDTDNVQRLCASAREAATTCERKARELETETGEVLGRRVDIAEAAKGASGLASRVIEILDNVRPVAEEAREVARTLVADALRLASKTRLTLEGLQTRPAATSIPSGKSAQAVSSLRAPKLQRPPVRKLELGVEDLLTRYENR